MQLQERLGHRHKDDPSSLSTEALVTLGTALNEEFKKISGGPNCDGQQELAIVKLHRLQDETTYKSHREFAVSLASKIRNVGYSIQQGHANREHYAGWAFFPVERFSQNSGDQTSITTRQRDEVNLAVVTSCRKTGFLPKVSSRYALLASKEALSLYS